MKNKVSSLICAIFVVTSILTGCGKEAGSDNNATSTVSNEAKSENINEQQQQTENIENNIDSSIDTKHLETLFDSDILDKDNNLENLDMFFDEQNRLVSITERGDDMAIYGVMTGGYATDYIDALADAGWLMNSTHLWEEKKENGEWHTMISTVFEKDNQELILTGDITETGTIDEEGDTLVTEVTLIDCLIADEIADAAGIDCFIDYTKTKYHDIYNPGVETLVEVAGQADKYRFSDFYRLMKLENQTQKKHVCQSFLSGLSDIVFPEKESNTESITFINAEQTVAFETDTDFSSTSQFNLIDADDYIKGLFGDSADIVGFYGNYIINSSKVYMSKSHQLVKDNLDDLYSYYSDVYSGKRDGVEAASTNESSYKTVPNEVMAEIKNNSGSHVSSELTKDALAENENKNASDVSSSDTSESSGDLDPKYLDITNWVGMDYNELNSKFTNFDIPSGLGLYLDDNNKVREVVLESSVFNMMGISPDSPYDKADAFLRNNGWRADGDFVGIPWSYRDGERARAKNYNLYTDAEVGDCVEADCFAYIKDGYVINLVVAYPEGQTYGSGKADYDHIFSIIYGKNQ